MCQSFKKRICAPYSVNVLIVDPKIYQTKLGSAWRITRNNKYFFTEPNSALFFGSYMQNKYAL